MRVGVSVYVRMCVAKGSAYVWMYMDVWVVAEVKV